MGRSAQTQRDPKLTLTKKRNSVDQPHRSKAEAIAAGTLRASKERAPTSVTDALEERGTFGQLHLSKGELAWVGFALAADHQGGRARLGARSWLSFSACRQKPLPLSFCSGRPKERQLLPCCLSPKPAVLDLPLPVFSCFQSWISRVSRSRAAA